MPSFYKTDFEGLVEDGFISLKFKNPGLEELFGLNVNAVNPGSLSACPTGSNSDVDKGMFPRFKDVEVPFFLARRKGKSFVAGEYLNGPFCLTTQLQLVDLVFASL